MKKVKAMFNVTARAGKKETGKDRNLKPRHTEEKIVQSHPSTVYFNTPQHSQRRVRASDVVVKHEISTISIV